MMSQDRLQAHGLTETEIWILSEIVNGTSETEVALQLLVYKDTLTKRLREIFRKIGVGTRTEAAAWLQRTGRCSA
jgi:DNA-binding NarL/FixJ family response regulator